MTDWTKAESWIEHGDVPVKGARIPGARNAARTELAALRAEVKRLRLRIQDAPEAWVWCDRIAYSREEMHALIGGRWATEDVEHVRLLAVEEAAP